MDLDIVRTFTVAARTLNFRRTAEKLYISQPTVTAHIRKLEETLGCELFVREGRGVRLSSAGKRFLPDAIALLEHYDSSVTALSQWLRGRRTTFRLAVSPLIARSILAPAIYEFSALHPETDLRVDIVESEEVGPMVVSGKARLGLSRIMHEEPGLHVSTLFYDPVLFVCGPEAVYQDADAPAWDELINKRTLLIRNHPTYWDEILTQLRVRDLYPRTLIVTDVDITKHFIEEGVGVSFLPRSAVYRELQQGRLIELPTPGLQLPIAATYVVEPAGQTVMTEQANVFLNLLRAKWIP